MKTTIGFFVILLLAPAIAAAQGARLQLDSLERLAARASETVNISIDQGMLQIASSVLNANGNDPKVKELVSALKGIYVRVFEFDSDQPYEADLDPVRRQLTSKQWVRIVSVDSRRDREMVEVYSFKEGDSTNGLAIVVAEPRELTVVNIVGPIDLAKLGALQGQFGIPKIEITP